MTRPSGDSAIFILTGAGISAESGVETFRDKGGIWSKVRLEDVATPEGFARDPDKVHAFYNARRAGLSSALPNPAHRALARLERDFPGRLTLVTQNIDDLHERAGSNDVVHMHGELSRSLCGHCGAKADASAALSTATACHACGREGGMRPDVVWFGEMPYRMDEIYERLVEADLFVSIGTSGAVYPAAGFVAEARSAGIRTLELNLEPSEGTFLFDEARHGPATALVPAFVEAVLAGVPAAGRPR
ncbi:NAD-dependent deacylase [Aurantimonas sp. 22II-16-19i]|uniref:NAD-dependent deacylase n=1 Tax=Aurantimonas sp. 22II-16-19i TaxID=1317114 RepID=UPI0009F7FB23|nr:NAD-dependent deacylase [Aurantimonas sp. 22II-16-19i]ORE92852.1 NAD-dependent deacetylase [Aurantimonas sp. 22II-16-19i]